MVTRLVDADGDLVTRAPNGDLARCLASEHDVRTAVNLWLATATDEDLAVFARTIIEQASAPGFRMPVPTQVPCPTCHEPPGKECRTWRDGVTTHHWPRWHAAIDAAAYSQAISTGNGGAVISAARNATDAPAPHSTADDTSRASTAATTGPARRAGAARITAPGHDS